MYGTYAWKARARQGKLRLIPYICSGTALVLWATGLAIVYGALDEIHQAFTPHRAMSVYDFLADALGAGMVASMWLSVRRRWSILVKS
jgi:VanZ family protein